MTVVHGRTVDMGVFGKGLNSGIVGQERSV